MKRKERKQLYQNIDQCVKFALHNHYKITCYHSANITKCKICYNKFLKDTTHKIAGVLNKLSKQPSLTKDFFNLEICIECDASKYIDNKCCERFKKIINTNLFLAVRFLLEVFSTASDTIIGIETKTFPFIIACLSDTKEYMIKNGGVVEPKDMRAKLFCGDIL